MPVPSFNYIDAIHQGIMQLKSLMYPLINVDKGDIAFKLSGPSGVLDFHKL